jgi:uncharacterized coiled-coil protein SlyX
MFVSAPHALEAVAQGGVGSGSAAAAQNMALESKITQQAAQIGAQGAVIQGLQSQLSSTQAQLQNLTTQITNLTGGFTDLTNTVSNTATPVGLTGYQLVTANSTTNNPAVARCPKDKKVIGGACGGTCDQQTSYAVMGDIGAVTSQLWAPTSGSMNTTSYTCQCIGGGTRTVSAYAVCANVD